MLIYRGNYNFVIASFDFNFSSIYELHNLKTTNGFLFLLKRSMRMKFKFLNEKFALYKMSLKKSKENNKSFSKTESGSTGGEWNTRNTRNPRVSNAEKGSEQWGKGCKGSIDTTKSHKKKSTSESKSSPKKEQDNNTHRHNKMKCDNSVPDSSYALGQQYYGGSYMYRQQMFFPQFFRNGVYAPSFFVPNSFYRSLSETSVTYQQLSNVCFNSSEKYSGAEGFNVAQTSPQHNTINTLRSWQSTRIGKTLEKSNGGKHPGITFKVMTYNVLAQDLLADHPELYKHNDPASLPWKNRWQKIYRDIMEHNCDIICLQEVQQSHLDKYFNTLTNLGYSGIYKQRTGYRTDGCAIYYKKDLFNLVEYTTVEFRQPDIMLLDRDNVGIIATLAPKDSPKAEFLMATTHLLYNPRRQDVRVAQMQVLLTEIERLAYRKINNESTYIPIILTGDLNTEPKSPLYNFIVKSILKHDNISLRTNYGPTKVLIPPTLLITDNCQHASLLQYRASNKQLTRKDEQKFVQLLASERKQVDTKNHSEYSKHKFASGTLTHNFSFKSVYKHTNNNDVEGTTYQDEWITVDYIFYSGTRDGNKNFKDDKLKLLSRFVLPTRSQLTNARIPNMEQGSDHLALLAKFKLEY